MAKIGRPTKYDPAYCDAVIEHMRDGASLTSFAASIGTSRDTVWRWTYDHPDFSDAVKAAKAACATWWEAASRKLALEGGGNAALVIFGLKNMAPEDWRDRRDVALSGPDGGPIQTEEVSARDVIRDRLARLAAGAAAAGDTGEPE